jgi:hypothetical protein
MLLGTMLDGLRAKLTEGSATYVGAMVWTLEMEEAPISAPVLAACLGEVWRTKTFPPSIAEMIELAKRMRERPIGLHNTICKLRDTHMAVAEILVFSGDLPESELDDVSPF